MSNKRALADALARRNLVDGYAERVAARLAAIPASDWRSAIDAVLDEYLVAGFSLVDFGGAPAPEAGPADDANHRVAARLAVLLSRYLGPLPGADPHRTVLICVEAADALLRLAFRTDPSGDEAVIAETRVLLRAYLARLLD